jgi:hypothetical protein
MTDDTLQRLAREAEVWAVFGAIIPKSTVFNERLARFAALVRVDALEQAAKVAKGYATMEGYENEIAAAILALKDKP